MRALYAPLLLSLSGSAWAQGLGEYKDQKHGERDNVTRDTCEQAYIERCRQPCGKDDMACRQECVQEAPAFCEARQVRQRRQTAVVVAKGATVGAGAAAVGVQSLAIAHRNKKALAEGKELVLPEETPYTIHWGDPSARVELGGGGLAPNIGVGASTVVLRFRSFGFSGANTYMADGTDTLSETDFGPTVFIASQNLIFGAQPSLLISAGNGVEPRFGGGLRSYTSLHVQQLVLFFDPMLGHINGQWNYHLRVGAGWRFTPLVYGRLSYDFRDVVDLRDLDISHAGLQGVVAQIGFRYN